MNSKNILVTGGCGFIGSNFINYLIDTYDEFNLINLDKYGIGSNINNIKLIRTQSQVIHTIKWDISDPLLPLNDDISLPFDYLFHFAAESHVDRSISTPAPFIQSNVMGTMQMMENARKMGIKRIINVNTDEVYGSVNKAVTEKASYNPSSIYSASKASSELICNAYKKTYGLNIITTRCSNNYGVNQYEEKLIPKVINNALNNVTIPIYDEGKQIREWTYVKDHIRDLIFLAKYGKSGEIYNVGKGYSISNIKLVKHILNILNKSENLIEFVPNARLGHDFKYSINTSKLNKLKLEKNEFIGKTITKKYFLEQLNSTITYYCEKFSN